MAVYNDTLLDNLTNPTDILINLGTMINQAHYDYSQYLISYLILFSFFIIFLVLAIRYNFTEVLIVDSFLTMVLTIIFYAAGMISGAIIVIPAIVMMIAIIFFFIYK